MPHFPVQIYCDFDVTQAGQTNSSTHTHFSSPENTFSQQERAELKLKGRGFCELEQTHHERLIILFSIQYVLLSLLLILSLGK